MIGYQVLFSDRPRFERFVQAFGRVCKLLERSKILTVAMVNGTCLAGGTELALACDLITLSDTARIGDGHLRFSMMPGSGVQRMVRAVGVQRARHWILTGDLVTAEVAVAAGLAIGAVSAHRLEDYTLEEVARICQASPLALAQVKSLIVTALTTSFDEGLEIEEQTAVGYATGSEDAIEGLRAFASKRAPRFTGR
jgi:enoyl-CoA hydratase